MLGHKLALGVIKYWICPTVVNVFVNVCWIVTPATVEFVPPEIPTPFVAVQVKFVLAVVDVSAMLSDVLEQIVSLLTNVAIAFGAGFTVIT